MTTFTTEDRIIAEKDGSYTVNISGVATITHQSLQNELAALLARIEFLEEECKALRGQVNGV